ncbi:Glycine dehydrogenase [decarboxylating] (Glycine decarboxylase) (Glycine cleavage system P-protein) [Propionibacterium freudenreichii subsp. freudenreichii]|uniref:Glycine dehydrogenase (decarboxylating) n=1 Tax=Propionibacterium freudenreichii subsp. freudenreichii TaxID=66712 RepID=A0A0B7NYJ1_PROFF|nr:Glycine dehydrogenase [decarboxylating] (Glycine decarboxylase) (Glycine cleavage system P-protein) [Propionibacterium freudenreichii subsp. freudenreichii]
MQWGAQTQTDAAGDDLTARFESRHIGPTRNDALSMLESLGLHSLDQLSDRAMPAQIRMTDSLQLPPARSEQATTARLSELAALNNPRRAMIGMGYYGTVTPSVIRRHVVENAGWYTAYTPYQPEISQGRLEALLNFQTMVADLTGLPLAGASLLDEATAVAEAAALAHRAQRGKGDTLVVDAGLLPQSLAVVQTRMGALDIKIVETDDLATSPALDEAFAVIVQTPTTDGRMQSTGELTELADAAHAKGVMVIAAADLLALTMAVPPGQWGADVVVGTTQRFGVPLYYGGPHAGYISVRKGLERQLPGRLVGVSRDADGVVAYRLALQTREQHIRRERATSNICTAQVLLAVVAAMYAVYHGPSGLRRIAHDIHQRTRLLAGALSAGGVKARHESFFDTLTVAAPGKAADVVARARELGVHLRLVDGNTVGISVGEDATDEDLNHVVAAFGINPDTQADPWGGFGATLRTDSYLGHRVFNSYHSETELMRYLRTLEDRDFALDRGMIPLGSCTMKLNPATAMEPISYPGFANLHPFAPAEDARGYRILIDELSDWLVQVSGYAACSLQPNSGASGEFTGLLAIRAYHESRADHDRKVCLIPSSAHGTNAASAAMAGLKVVTVHSAHDGQVDLADLATKIAENPGRIAAIMVTYPSTHGVFEDTITRLCEMVHEAGGQVYIDGANMNALVGLARPGRFGGDVTHLNLHKTFAIPHGGGGPGVGPIVVADHLVEFLPNHPVVPMPDARIGAGGTVSAAPWGSAGVLAISYAYIAMMGPDGLTKATQMALLNANYIAHRLSDYYPVLYTGANDLVAHECILDLRELSASTGVSVDDVAKRLIDYGFHAPTMSFPVPGTLMVEPTESEDLGELDRFCDAMIAIRAEMDKVASGAWPVDDNPLVNAPHPVSRIGADEWSHPYPRSVAAFPAGHHTGPIEGEGSDKYWPAVARIDNAFGDRHLLCVAPTDELLAQQQ